MNKLQNLSSELSNWYSSVFEDSQHFCVKVQTQTVVPTNTHSPLRPQALMKYTPPLVTVRDYCSRYYMQSYNTDSDLVINRLLDSNGIDRSSLAAGELVENVLVREPVIFRLPQELLDTICDFATYRRAGCEEWERDDYGARQRAAYALCASCKRLNRIALPYLYQSFMMFLTNSMGGSNGFQTVVSNDTETFQLSLLANPPLRQLCRSLYIGFDNSHFSDHHRPSSDLTNHLLGWLTNTTCLRVEADSILDPVESRITQAALKSMEHIEELTLVGPFVEHVLTDMPNMQCLRKLDLRDVDSLPNWEENTMENLKALHLIRTSSPEEDLARFLKSPKRLEQFTLSSVTTTRHYQMNAIQSILSPQQHSLESISLPMTDGIGIEDMDLSQFSKLKSIQLSPGALEPCTLAAAYSLLGTNQLRTFIWDLWCQDHHFFSCWGSALNANTLDWLKGFADVATAENGLREVVIIFRPRLTFRRADSPAIERFGYPWDHLDEIRQNLSIKGIELSYTPPSITKAQFKRILKKQKGKEWF